MMNQTYNTLEFDKIRSILEGFAYTDAAKKKAREISPCLAEKDVLYALKETTEARKMLDQIGTPPMVSLEHMEEYLIGAQQGGCLMAEQLEYIMITLTAVRRLRDYLCRGKYLEIGLPFYEAELNALEDLREELSQKVRNGRVDDGASKLLRNLRREVEVLDQKMRNKAENMLRSHKEYFSDSFVVLRNGRLCLPVKKEYKFKISGSAIEKSSTGATIFVEPTAIASLFEELQNLKLDEENEERRILYELTGMVADEAEILRCDIRMIEKLDFIFAKGRLSQDMEARKPQINTERRIKVVQARHPFITKQTCVPLDFELGGEIRGVIITGPNTGGKTVAIKTVGLLSLMAQCGLHIPCEQGDFSMQNQILCDIGDGQNITENLSTFSAHITNVLDILKRANRDSLVIMDELGSGTDPTEGMGIAVAILEELQSCECSFLVTTHYPEVKNYAEKTERVRNARMAFDRESLKPLYRLEIGEAGESCAFYIAKRLGMPNHMLRQASISAYGTEEIQYLDLSSEDIIKREHAPIIHKKQEIKSRNPEADQYQRGDSVMIHPDLKIGIVCQPVNDKGIMQVQLQDKRIWINHKRVKLNVKAEELYPEDYDFSIVFDTVENRKARHQMEKKYSPDLAVILEEYL